MIDSLSDILADFSLSDQSPALPEAVPARDIFALHSRKGWDSSIEARCNFEYRPRLTRRGDVWFFSIWQKSLMGRTLTDIKSDPAEIPHFAVAVSDFIREVLGGNLSSGQWCICTTPKRRHKERNFASLVAQSIADSFGIPFYEDVATCRNRQRVNAVFDLNVVPKEPNVIVFDDFVTSGSTVKAMHEVLAPLNKILIFFTGINNKL